MSSKIIRAVVVHRPTDYELLIATHGTRGQAEFFLRSHNQAIDAVERDHAAIHAAISAASAAIPATWRRTSIGRSELSRFLFEPDDVVIAVGQDGLVANVAKYLSGQTVIGVNPLPDQIDGLLVRHSPGRVGELLKAVDGAGGGSGGGALKVQSRTMVQARLHDGQVLVALNELFVGHRSHQSARYRIALGKQQERQSSSGLICSTGTGATGWACSINRALGGALKLPAPSDAAVSFFVREAWPSKGTGTSIAHGVVPAGECVTITSEMNQGGVIFGDGIEDDYLPFGWGSAVSIGVAPQRLNLVE